MALRVRTPKLLVYSCDLMHVDSLGENKNGNYNVPAMGKSQEP